MTIFFSTSWSTQETSQKLLKTFFFENVKNFAENLRNFWVKIFFLKTTCKIVSLVLENFCPWPRERLSSRSRSLLWLRIFLCSWSPALCPLPHLCYRVYDYPDEGRLVHTNEVLKTKAANTISLKFA